MEEVKKIENEIEIRGNLTISLKRWNAKTKKDFIALFRKKGSNVNEDEIRSVLVDKYINLSTDFYLTNDEIQYIIIKLKEISLNEEVVFEMDCEFCSEAFEVSSTLKDIVHYSPSTLSSYSDDLCSLRDLDSIKSIKDVISKFPDENPEYLKLLLSVIKLNDKESESIKGVLDDFDELSLKDYNIIEENYNDNKSKLYMGLEIECPHCKKSKGYEFDIIPNFFKELMPKG